MVTKNGASILPTLDIAYEIPIPVDLISVGNVYEIIKEKKVNAKVLDSLLNPIRLIYKNDCCFRN